MPATDMKFAGSVDEGSTESKAVYLPSGDAEHIQQFNRMPSAVEGGAGGRSRCPHSIQMKQSVEELPPRSGRATGPDASPATGTNAG